MGEDRSGELTARFRQLGLSDGSARVAATAEMDEGSPVLATDALLRLCRPELIERYDRPGAFAALASARRLADAGASLEDLRQVARGFAFEAIFGVLYLLDEGPGRALREHMGIVEGAFPGWGLVELGQAGEPTGRYLGCVYEGLRRSDPSGRQGGDFLDQ